MNLISTGASQAHFNAGPEFTSPALLFKPTNETGTSGAAAHSQVLGWWPHLAPEDIAASPAHPEESDLRDVWKVLQDNVPSDALIWPRGDVDEYIEQPDWYFAIMPRSGSRLSQVIVMGPLEVTTPNGTHEGSVLVGLIDGETGFRLETTTKPGTEMVKALTRFETMLPQQLAN